MQRSTSHGHDHRGSRGAIKPWYRALGSQEQLEFLVASVLEHANAVAGPGTTSRLSIDIEAGVVTECVEGWSADLRPLVARLTSLPPAGWSPVVGHEVERWYRLAEQGGSIGAETRTEVGGVQVAPVVRLAPANSVPGGPAKPAFGDLRWEIVIDLGGHGVATSCGACGTSRTPRWDRVAADTVARHQDQWALLEVQSGVAGVASGPWITSLLHRPGWIARLTTRPPDGRRTAITVFSNSLLLIADPDDDAAGELEPVAESLRLFSATTPHRFEPFTLLLEPTATSDRWRFTEL